MSGGAVNSFRKVSIGASSDKYVQRAKINELMMGVQVIRFRESVATLFGGLLGICFWREGIEAVLGPERRGVCGESNEPLKTYRQPSERSTEH